MATVGETFRINNRTNIVSLFTTLLLKDGSKTFCDKMNVLLKFFVPTYLGNKDFQMYECGLGERSM